MMSHLQHSPSPTKKSLLLRVGIGVITIFSLAVAGMLSSVFISDTTEGYAAAINQAGTLRMQSYRIASSLVHGTSSDVPSGSEITSQLVDEFEQRLFSPRLHNVLLKGPSKRVVDAYQVVEKKWQKNMQSHVRVYVALINEKGSDTEADERISNLRQYFLSNVDAFVDDIHHFVKVLELDAEKKNQQLRMIQIIALVLIMIVGLVSIFLTQTRVLSPLKDLLSSARAARVGDFSVRCHHTADDELGQLGAAFNVMAEDLSKTYADLEERVQEKTADLEQSNRSLEMLYRAAMRLNESPLSVEVLEELVHDIEHFMEVRSGTICFGKPGDKQAFRMAFTRDICKEPQNLTHADCSRCLVEGSACVLTEGEPINQLNRLLSTPIRDKQQQYGVLLIELEENAVLEEWQHRLLETVASHIALAVNVAQRESQNRMLSLLEERSVIARELHDSLAQTLSYLKIQVSKLDKTITEDRDKKSVLEITAVLRDALNGAYRQLRELLKTFRLRISEAGLTAALEETVEEFRERGNIEIELVDRIANCRFNPNAEIHIVQIIRESLSNVVRHANASHARVFIECNMDGQVSILVDDDGIGIEGENEKILHYGLPIMQERAEWLGGTLLLGRSPMGGTRVELTFAIINGDHKTLE